MTIEDYNKLSNSKNTDNTMPVSIFDLIKKINSKVIDIKDDSKFIIKSNWLIINTDWKWCKGYCMWENDIPSVCSKWEQCKNFWRASTILKKVQDFKNDQVIKDIY